MTFDARRCRDSLIPARRQVASVTETELLAIIDLVAADPAAGDLMEGTGGARKLRFAAKGKGKSGGYRIITFFAAQDLPVFLLDIFAKGEKVNLSKAERNELRGILSNLADEWRASVKARTISLGKR
jgi:hypothetical protein